MQVESTGFPIQNVESMQYNPIQIAYAPAPVITQQPQGTTLRRRSNVDGNFHSHEFDHEEVIEVMSEGQISSVDEPWNRVFEAPKRFIQPQMVCYGSVHYPAYVFRSWLNQSLPHHSTVRKAHYGSVHDPVPVSRS